MENMPLRFSCCKTELNLKYFGCNRGFMNNEGFVLVSKNFTFPLIGQVQL